jgi:hypothetical protein
VLLSPFHGGMARSGPLRSQRPSPSEARRPLPSQHDLLGRVLVSEWTSVMSKDCVSVRVCEVEAPVCVCVCVSVCARVCLRMSVRVCVNASRECVVSVTCVSCVSCVSERALVRSMRASVRSKAGCRRVYLMW